MVGGHSTTRRYRAHIAGPAHRTYRFHTQRGCGHVPVVGTGIAVWSGRTTTRHAQHCDHWIRLCNSGFAHGSYPIQVT